jgi:hypothetical protein
MHRAILRIILTTAMLGTLAGCADPRRQCVRDVTAELQALDAQIAASQRALATGRREEVRRPAVTVGVSICGNPTSNAQICADTIRPPQRVLVAVDPAVEGRTLSALQARRAELLANRDRDIARCAAAR